MGMISLISLAYIFLAFCFVCLTFFVRRNIKVVLELILLNQSIVAYQKSQRDRQNKDRLNCLKTQKSNCQSLIADISIGLVLGTVVVVGVLSVLNNEASLYLDQTPSKLEVRRLRTPKYVIKATARRVKQIQASRLARIIWSLIQFYSTYVVGPIQIFYQTCH